MTAPREWVIVYDGGAVFTDQDGPPELAPRTGVQVVYNRDTEGHSRTGFLRCGNLVTEL